MHTVKSWPISLTQASRVKGNNTIIAYSITSSVPCQRNEISQGINGVKEDDMKAGEVEAEVRKEKREKWDRNRKRRGTWK